MGISFSGFGTTAKVGQIKLGIKAIIQQIIESLLAPTYENETEAGWDITYTLSGNYDYSQIPSTISSGVNITAGLAALHEWIEITFDVPFTTESNYALESNTTMEITGGTVHLKNV